MESSLNDQWKYDDPNPQDRGILLTNQIHELCQKKLLISEDYEPNNLRPASYTLRIGDDYVDSQGKRRRLTETEDSFIFEKNSIVFVSTKEKLDLPYYIVARFNIRVNWVYEGVLLGTGPQVDPGFSGFLSCPLYNLTNVDITIKRGEAFATIDFEKTTTLLGDLPWEQRKKLIRKAKDKQLETVGGQRYSFFKTSSFNPLQHTKSHRIESSLFEMREEVRTWRRLGIGAIIAFFGLTLSLLAFGTNLYRDNSELREQLKAAQNDLLQTNQRISTMEADIKLSRAAIDSLSSAKQQSQPTAGVAKSQ